MLVGAGLWLMGVSYACVTIAAAAVTAEAVLPVSDEFGVCHCVVSDVKWLEEVLSLR